jgi:CheY-like chemotaxis protein
MPDMNGAMLGRKIISDARLRNLKMIMLASEGKRGDAKKYRKIGFAAYFCKPVNPDDIYECLRQLAGRPSVLGDISPDLITHHSIREYQAGMNGFVGKPVKLQTIAASVQKVIKD